MDLKTRLLEPQPETNPLARAQLWCWFCSTLILSYLDFFLFVIFFKCEERVIDRCRAFLVPCREWGRIGLSQNTCLFLTSTFLGQNHSAARTATKEVTDCSSQTRQVLLKADKQLWVVKWKRWYVAHDFKQLLITTCPVITTKNTILVLSSLWVCFASAFIWASSWSWDLASYRGRSSFCSWRIWFP